jgi:hypothetical protein
MAREEYVKIVLEPDGSKVDDYLKGLGVSGTKTTGSGAGGGASSSPGQAAPNTPSSTKPNSKKTDDEKAAEKAAKTQAKEAQDAAKRAVDAQRRLYENTQSMFQSLNLPGARAVSQIVNFFRSITNVFSANLHRTMVGGNNGGGGNGSPPNILGRFGGLGGRLFNARFGPNTQTGGNNGGGGNPPPIPGAAGGRGGGGGGANIAGAAGAAEGGEAAGGAMAGAVGGLALFTGGVLVAAATVVGLTYATRQITDALTEFSPKIMGMSMQFNVQSMMFNRQLASAFEGTMTGWINFKEKLLQIGMGLMPLFEQINSGLTGFINGLNTAITWIATKLHINLGDPSELNEKQKAWNAAFTGSIAGFKQFAAAIKAGGNPKDLSVEYGQQAATAKGILGKATSNYNKLYVMQNGDPNAPPASPEAGQHLDVTNQLKSAKRIMDEAQGAYNRLTGANQAALMYANPIDPTLAPLGGHPNSPIPPKGGMVLPQNPYGSGWNLQLPEYHSSVRAPYDPLKHGKPDSHMTQPSDTHTQALKDKDDKSKAVVADTMKFQTTINQDVKFNLHHESQVFTMMENVRNKLTSALDAYANESQLFAACEVSSIEARCM